MPSSSRNKKPLIPAGVVKSRESCPEGGIQYGTGATQGGYMSQFITSAGTMTDYAEAVYAFNEKEKDITWSYWYASAILWHCRQLPDSPMAQSVRSPRIKASEWGLRVYSGQVGNAVLLLMQKGLGGRLTSDEEQMILGQRLGTYMVAEGKSGIGNLEQTLMADGFEPYRSFEPGPTLPRASSGLHFDAPPALDPSQWATLDPALLLLK